MAAISNQQSAIGNRKPVEETHASPLRWIIVGILLCIGVNDPARAESAYAGEFLTLGVGARALAMGGGYAAVADDATAAYWNPAGLGQLTRFEGAFMHSTLYGLDSYDYVNVARPFGQSVWSVSWLRVGVDDIIVTTVKDNSSPVSTFNRPTELRTTNISNNAFALAWGRKVWNSTRVEAYAGGAGKFLLLTAGAPRGANAIGFGGDAAVLGVWRLSEGTRIRGAANLQDFFRTNLYWNTIPPAGEPSNKDTILPNAKLGVALVQRVPPGETSTLTLNVETDSKFDFETHYGAEWNLGDTLALRAGMLERKSDAETLRDATAGAGFQLGFTGGQSFSIDYAFTGGDLGDSHRVSLGVQF